jgi:large subunit ribosomal protein L25
MPSEVTLTAEPRTTGGTRPSRRLRREGRIPAVVYGRGGDPTPVTVGYRDLRAALTTEAGLNAILNLQVDGETVLAIVKEIQRHPVRNDVAHVDFIRISRDVAVTVEVPVVLEGEATQVLQHDGTVEQVLHTLTVSAKPGSIPNEITVDVTGLDIGESIRVGDLSLPSGATTEVDPEEPIVIAQVSQAAIEAEALEAEAAEAAEAAEGAEGEPPAAEGETEGEGGEAAATESAESEEG